MERRFQIHSGRKARHAFRGDLHGVAAARIADTARLALGHAECSEAGDGHPVAANQTGLNSLQEGLQRRRGLHSRQSRLRRDNSNQVSFRQRVTLDAREFYQKRDAGVNRDFGVMFRTEGSRLRE